MVKARRQDPRSVSDIDRHIGARLRARRIEIAMSQEQLGEEISVTFQQIQKYEKGVNRVSAATLVLIAEALGVSVTALLPPLHKGGCSETIAIDDPEAMDLVTLYVRLNSEGRRVLAGVVRSLASDPKLRSKA